MAHETCMHSDIGTANSPELSLVELPNTERSVTTRSLCDIAKFCCRTYTLLLRSLFGSSRLQQVDNVVSVAQTAGRGLC